MNKNGEEPLWARLRSGDKSALREIYDQEYSYLYNYGRKVFDKTELVEDCIHDLFVDIWRRHERLGETTSIRRYLAASLRRNAVALIKRNAKVQNEEAIDQLNFDTELSIDEIMINGETSHERVQKLHRAFADLSARQKEIIYLKFYQGLDYEEISEVMDISYQSLRNTMSKAIKALRTTMTLLLVMILTSGMSTNVL